MSPRLLLPVCLAFVLAETALADDEDKVYVLVEIRGVLRHTAKSTFVDTKHKIGTRGTEEVKRTWQLDLTDAKIAPEELQKLHGKVVALTGKAEMSPVRQFLSTKGGVVPVTTFEVQGPVIVGGLKEIQGRK